jgi:carboxyl-terminal processing protease
VQEQSEWSDGSATRLTVARYFTPNGRSIQRPYKEEMAFDQVPADSMLGGILPDVVVGRDTAGITWLFAEAVHRGLLTQFAYDYRDKELNQGIAQSEEAFLTGVSESAIADAMYIYLKRVLGEINEQEWKKSRERMALRAKALIGRSLFTEETYYKVYNDRDIFVQTAHVHLYENSKVIRVMP